MPAIPAVFKDVKRTLCAAANRLTAIAAVGVLSFAALGCGTNLTTERVAAGLSSPVFATAPPGDTQRLFIVEQTGTIRILDLATDTLKANPFLAVSVTSGGERGLLGLAFDPAYAENGFFYVDYTRVVSSQLTTFVSRFHVSGADPDVADPNSDLVILTIDQPYDNHNAGWIAFGPDGYLYVATGDGGSGGDPGGRAQDITDQWLGKLLRLDVSNASSANPYDVPPDNPFVGQTGDDEIWAYGLRNPWRPSFDRATGDLYIADVGQAVYEEVDFQPATSTGGENYGWRCYEADAPYNTSGCVPAATMVFPIYSYSHGGSPSRCAITGGYVYRGARIWDLRGTYFFADYCSSQIWSFRYDGAAVTDLQDRTAELDPPGFTINSISSFGEDASGELYICDLDGEVFRVIPDGPVVGDMNVDGSINGLDVDAFVLALTDPDAYRQQYVGVEPTVTGDINCDDALDGLDIDPFVNLLVSQALARQ